jgi:hypothetical protein
MTRLRSESRAGRPEWQLPRVPTTFNAPQMPACIRGRRPPSEHAIKLAPFLWHSLACCPLSPEIAGGLGVVTRSSPQQTADTGDTMLLIIAEPD